MILAIVNAIFYAVTLEAWKKIQDFNGIWNRDLAIPVRRSNQLSYKATDVAGGQAIFEWKRVFFQLLAILTWFLILGKIHPRRRPRRRSLLVPSQASNSANTHKLYFIS